MAYLRRGVNYLGVSRNDLRNKNIFTRTAKYHKNKMTKTRWCFKPVYHVLPPRSYFKKCSTFVIVLVSLAKRNFSKWQFTSSWQRWWCLKANSERVLRSTFEFKNNDYKEKKCDTQLEMDIFNSSFFFKSPSVSQNDTDLFITASIKKNSSVAHSNNFPYIKIRKYIY